MAPLSVSLLMVKKRASLLMEPSKELKRQVSRPLSMQVVKRTFSILTAPELENTQMAESKRHILMELLRAVLRDRTDTFNRK